MICVDVQGPDLGVIPPIRRWFGPAETATLGLMVKSVPGAETSPSGRSVCARIRQEREARNWTQDYLAGRVGVTEQTISRYERDRPPKIAMLSKIAGVMGLSVHDFMPEERVRDPGLAELIAFWNSASKFERKLLLQQSRTLQDAREPDDNGHPVAFRR